MTLRIEPRHELSPEQIDAIEDRLYRHNSAAIGQHDARGLGFVIRDTMGHVAGVVAGYTWAGAAELKQMWVDGTWRGLGYGHALLEAFETEARHRGARRIWVSSHGFQAPEFYEKAGYQRMAELDGWPEGHTNVILCKSLSEK